MTGAMYAGISGLKAHMSKLNVIGNNIANVNTYGYKSARTTFRETLYTTQTAGSDGTALVGGTNPSQFGYGCNIGTIDLDMSTNTAVPTGVNMDCMIQGDGFFLIGDKSGVTVDTLDSLMLSKVGDFKFDQDGYLTDGSGNIVYGFLTTVGTVGRDQTTGEITSFEPTNTPDAAKGDNLGTSTQLVPIRLPMAAAVADQNGAYKAGDPIYPGWDETTGKVVEDLAGVTNGERVSCNVDSIFVDKNGKITATTESGTDMTVGYIALGRVDNPSGLTHLEGPYYQALAGAGDLSITTANSAVTGYLNNATDQTAGAVRIVGSDNSLLSGFLEGSGTDLATEFSEMITTQRGYQANTRIITVTDSMLEELVNMKR